MLILCSLICLGRSLFVEAFTEANPQDHNLWEGAATMMGNSLAAWRRVYNPSRKRRLAQLAVNAHASCSHQPMSPPSRRPSIPTATSSMIHDIPSAPSSMRHAPAPPLAHASSIGDVEDGEIVAGEDLADDDEQDIP